MKIEIRTSLSPPLVLLILVWFFNINDLLRGNWFYFSASSILILNFFGVVSFLMIIFEYRKRLKDALEERKK